eukprot:CAMPEP_0194510568 /NCGR_PEP_ID=MMETSP0253-20130528/41960_1 /TAXON_ID=2966 /ORGANISM="Noctiluca scintillans" /LENGTH=67 /DNA_ID=CAMNT_0039353821 /DNA_START=72 /DNA_END=275 /DNA_ORIENTATION=+
MTLKICMTSRWATQMPVELDRDVFQAICWRLATRLYNDLHQTSPNKTCAVESLSMANKAGDQVTGPA